MNRRYVAFHLFLAVAVFLSLASAQTAPVASRITAPVNDAVRTTLPNTIHPAVRAAHDLGPVDANYALNRMMLLLKPSTEQKAALKKLLDEQQNKNSTNYHKWLTPEDFAQRFGPSEADAAKVTGWLKQHGFQVASIGRGRRWVEFSGTAGQVQNAFRTSIHRFNYKGERHIANASEVSLPSALTPVVSGVLSLHDFRKEPANTGMVKVARNEKGVLAPSDPNWTFITDWGDVYFSIAPADFHKIYNVKPVLESGIDGSGVSIAVLGRSNIYLTDIQQFRRIFGLPQNDPNIIFSGPDPGIASGNDMGEASLDLEWAGAVAPGATINYVVAGSTNTTDGIDLAAAYAVDHAISPIITVSYSLCEGLLGPGGNEFYNAVWAQAAAQGITVFVSTGDSGSGECDMPLQRLGYEDVGPAMNGPTVSGLASTPYNVAVGGTQFNEGTEVLKYWSLNNDPQQGSVLGYIPERVWNMSCDPTLPVEGTNCAYGQNSYSMIATGGGPSSCIDGSWDGEHTITCGAGHPKPAWQTGIGVPDDGVRDIPDVSFNASPADMPYVMCAGGGCLTTTYNGQTVITNAITTGGTSVSTPAMAGIMALVEQQHGTYQGQANYILYRLAALDDRDACDSSARTDPAGTTSCIFNDITLGDNSVPWPLDSPFSTDNWSAGKGYDMATGLGTINAANLVANWSKVTFRASSVTLSTEGNTLGHGQALTVNVAVSAADNAEGTPSGEFALVTDKYGVVGSGTLEADGTFSAEVDNLPGGTYALTARYAGDGTFGASTSQPVMLTVSSEGSTSSLEVYAVDDRGDLVPPNGTATFGRTIVFKAFVASESGTGFPTGSFDIEMEDEPGNWTALATATLNASGTAMVLSGGGFPFELPVGTHNVRLRYKGDNSFSASTSSAVSVTLDRGQDATWTSVRYGGQTATVGHPVLMWTSLTHYGNVKPTGKVQFYDNETPIGPPLDIVYDGPSGPGAPQARYVTTFDTVGDHNITAGYSGDENFQPIDHHTDHGWGMFTVTESSGATSVVTVTQTPTTVYFGDSITYLVDITPTEAGGPVPTGEVWLYSDGTVSNIVPVVNGKAQVPAMQQGAGVNHVYVTYTGDEHYAASTSAGITTTVLRRDPVVSLTTPSNYVPAGAQTTLNFVAEAYIYNKYGGVAPSGSVEFLDVVNGEVQQSLGIHRLNSLEYSAAVSIRVTLSPGTHVITASYPGEPYFNPAVTKPVTILVAAADFLFTSDTSQVTVPTGGSATASLRVERFLGFSAPVALNCGTGLPAGTSCIFSPSTIAAGGSQSTLTLVMQGPPATQAQNMRPRSGWFLAGGSFGLAGILLFGVRRRRTLAALLVALCAVSLMIGCGGGGSTPAPRPTPTPQTSTVVLSTSEAKVPQGTTVTLTAAVSGGQSAGGRVTFYDGTTAIGNADVSGGSAALSVSNLTAGMHSITAQYGGDAQHTPSTSNAVHQAVTGTTNLQVLATSGSTTQRVELQVVVE